MDQFFNKIKNIIENDGLIDKNLHYPRKCFMMHLQNLLSQETDPQLKITNMTILFEGFYQSIIDENSHLKKQLIILRQKRWRNHFGIPTITFLMTHRTQINKIKSQLETDIQSENLLYNYSDQSLFLFDEENQVLVNKQSLNALIMPRKEKKGELLKTYNPSGGFTTTLF